MKIIMIALAMSLSMSSFAAGSLRCELTDDGSMRMVKHSSISVLMTSMLLQG